MFGCPSHRHSSRCGPNKTSTWRRRGRLWWSNAQQTTGEIRTDEGRCVLSVPGVCVCVHVCICVYVYVCLSRAQGNNVPVGLWPCGTGGSVPCVRSVRQRPIAWRRMGHTNKLYTHVYLYCADCARALLIGFLCSRKICCHTICLWVATTHTHAHKHVGFFVGIMNFINAYSRGLRWNFPLPPLHTHTQPHTRTFIGIGYAKNAWPVCTLFSRTRGISARVRVFCMCAYLRRFFQCRATASRTAHFRLRTPIGRVGFDTESLVRSV